MEISQENFGKCTGHQNYDLIGKQNPDHSRLGLITLSINFYHQTKSVESAGLPSTKMHEPHA